MMIYLKNTLLSKLPLFTIIFLALSIGASVYGNVFDGIKIDINASATGGSSATVFLGGNVYVQAPSTAGITACTGGLPVAYIGGNTWEVTRDSGNGKWCFQSPSSTHLVSWVPSTTTPYIWLANNNSTGFYNVKDFGALGDNAANDTFAVRNAILYTAAKLGGTLYFPAGKFRVDSTLSLPSGILIQGAMTKLKPVYTNTGATQIILITQNIPLFRIGEDLENIGIRNIELTATANNGTTGVEAVGKFTVLQNGGILGPTQNVFFENMIFSNFDKGLSVLTAGTNTDWQFDYIRVESCQFAYNKTAGIYSDVYNSDWNIISTVFYLPLKASGVAADGIYVGRAMNMLVQNTFGGGDGPSRTGGDFLDVRSIAALQVLNSECESLTNSIVFGDDPNAGNLATTISVSGSIFASPILLKKRSTYISSGNYYGGHTVNASDSKVMIYSTGDRFCEDSTFLGGAGGVGCGGSGGTGTTGVGFQGIGKVVFQTGQFKDGAIDGIPATIGLDTEIKGDVTTVGTKAALRVSVPNSTGSGKILFEVGEDPFFYRLSRDTGNGYLRFTGTQGTPWQGYKFDAPVTISVKTLTQIYGEGVAGQGTLIYCSDCNAGSSPCSSGGSGALAVNTGSIWACK